MKNYISIQKLSLAAVLAAFLGVGCSSTKMSQNGQDNPSTAVSVLSYSPITATKVLPKFPPEYNVRVIEMYTFTPPEPSVAVTADLPAFNEDLPPGSVFVEAAGADRPAKVRRVIQHTPAAH